MVEERPRSPEGLLSPSFLVCVSFHLSFSFCFCFLSFETGFHYVALELTI